MNDLEKKLFDFAVKTIKFVRTLPETPEFRVISYQLLKSTTSAGANYEEAQAGSSKPDFNNKSRISLRETRESNYWLRLVKEILENKSRITEIEYLIQESFELKKILGSIVQKTRNK